MCSDPGWAQCYHDSDEVGLLSPQNLEAMRSNHSKLLQEIELLNSKLKEVI